MGVCIASFEIMTVIRGDQRDPQLPVHVNQALIDSLLLVKSIGLELEIEPIRTEDVEKVLGGHGRGSELFLAEEGGDFTVKTARQCNQARTVAAQQGLVYAGFVIETLRVAVTDQANEVLVSETVLG